MTNNTKLKRFKNSFQTSKNKKGFCDYENCETLDGIKGNACCKLEYVCPFLVKNCAIYIIRARNCRVFPNSEDDLKLVKKCGFYFD